VIFNRKVIAGLLGLALVGPYAAWKTYKHYDHEVHVYIESHPRLRDLRDSIRLWPWPSNYLECSSAAPSPIARFEAPGIVVDGKLYFFGGFFAPHLPATTQCDRYDPETDSWERLRDLPEPVTHAGFARHDRTIWIAGGFVGDHPGKATTTVWKYDVDQDTWAPGVPLPEARAAGGLVIVDGMLHYFGGSEADRSTDSGTHWVMEMVTKEPSWQEAAPMPFRRHHMGVAVLGGKIYAIGGQRNHDWAGPGLRPQVDTDRVDIYHPGSDTWSDGPPLPRAKAHFEPGTFLWRGKICIAGGESGFAQALYDIHCYDPAEQGWIEIAGLPEPLRAPAVRPLGNRWFVGTGGVMPSGARPTAKTWLCAEPSG
jgi:hypothetical protein